MKLHMLPLHERNEWKYNRETHKTSGRQLDTVRWPRRHTRHSPFHPIIILEKKKVKERRKKKLYSISLDFIFSTRGGPQTKFSLCTRAQNPIFAEWKSLYLRPLPASHPFFLFLFFLIEKACVHTQGDITSRPEILQSPGSLSTRLVNWWHPSSHFAARRLRRLVNLPSFPHTRGSRFPLRASIFSPGVSYFLPSPLVWERKRHV